MVVFCCNNIQNGGNSFDDRQLCESQPPHVTFGLHGTFITDVFFITLSALTVTRLLPLFLSTSLQFFSTALWREMQLELGLSSSASFCVSCVVGSEWHNWALLHWKWHVRCRVIRHRRCHNHCQVQHHLVLSCNGFPQSLHSCSLLLCGQRHKPPWNLAFSSCLLVNHQMQLLIFPQLEHDRRLITVLVLKHVLWRMNAHHHALTGTHNHIGGGWIVKTTASHVAMETDSISKQRHEEFLFFVNGRGCEHTLDAWCSCSGL